MAGSAGKKKEIWMDRVFEMRIMNWNEFKATADAGTANSTIQEHYWTGGGAEIDALGKSIDGSVADSFYVDKKGKRNLW